MKLLDRLIKKRDMHAAAMQKCDDLIAVLRGDVDLDSIVQQSQAKIATLAKARFDVTQGNGNGHEAPKKKYRISPAVRKRMALRMKKLWKENREKMLKGVQKGGKIRAANNRGEATT